MTIEISQEKFHENAREIAVEIAQEFVDDEKNEILKMLQSMQNTVILGAFVAKLEKQLFRKD